MPYTGSNPDLMDIQNQITADKNAASAAIQGIQTQIKQVTLSLEGQLRDIKQAFDALKQYVLSRVQP